MASSIRIILCTLALAGCAAIDGYPLATVTPQVSKEGQQTFLFTVTKNPSGRLKTAADVRKFHEDWLAMKLAEIKYCMGGYTIGEPRDVGFGIVQYNGACK